VFISAVCSISLWILVTLRSLMALVWSFVISCELSLSLAVRCGPLRCSVQPLLCRLLRGPRQPPLLRHRDLVHVRRRCVRQRLPLCVPPRTARSSRWFRTSCLRRRAALLRCAQLPIVLPVSCRRPLVHWRGSPRDAFLAAADTGNAVYVASC